MPSFLLLFSLTVLPLLLLLVLKKRRLILPAGQLVPGTSWTFPVGDAVRLVRNPRSMRHLHRKYGNLYFVWLGNTKFYLIAHPQIAKAFYTTQKDHSKPLNLGFGYPFDQLMGECLGVMDGEQWRHMHKSLAPLFATPHVNEFSSKHLVALVTQWLGDLPKNNFSADVYTTVVKLPLLVMGSAIYGNMSEEDFMRLVRLSNLHEGIMDNIFMNALCKIPGYKYLPVQLNRVMQTFKRDWDAFNVNFLERAHSSSLEQGCMIRDFVCDLSNDTFTWTQLLHTLDEILFANVDISGASLSWILYFLAVHPDVQQRLFVEINSNVANHGNSLTQYLAQSDSYLTCVEYEAARLGNVFPFTMAEVIHEPKELNGFVLPSEAMVGMDFAAINRNHEVWEDPDSFNPSRFEIDANSKYAKVLRFGFGPVRRCLGQRYARIVLRTMTTMLLQRFSVMLASPTPVELTTPPVKPKSFLIPDVHLSFVRRIL